MLRRLWSKLPPKEEEVNIDQVGRWTLILSVLAVSHRFHADDGGVNTSACLLD